MFMEVEPTGNRLVGPAAEPCGPNRSLLRVASCRVGPDSAGGESPSARESPDVGPDFAHGARVIVTADVSRASLTIHHHVQIGATDAAVTGMQEDFIDARFKHTAVFEDELAWRLVDRGAHLARHSVGIGHRDTLLAVLPLAGTGVGMPDKESEFPPEICQGWICRADRGRLSLRARARNSFGAGSS